MAEYVDKKDLRNALYDADAITISGISIINRFPAADVMPVIHGYNEKHEYPSLFKCSVCGCECWDTIPCDVQEFNYCPNCGAKIGGEYDGRVHRT